MNPQHEAKLARMADQVAAAFHALPDDEAAAAIAAHINQFWAPPMRRTFLARFAADPAPLAPCVRRALKLIRAPAPRQ
jgi:formate dehydrogenase subunit delta